MKEGSLFRGIFALSLDAKGRFAIPTRYRERLLERCQGQLVATVDQTGCLLLYPLPDWEEVEQEINRLPSFVAPARELQRMMVSHASDCEMETHGRVLIPPLLRQFAALERNVVLIGQGRRLEVWNEDTWNTRCRRWQTEADGAVPVPELAQLTL